MADDVAALLEHLELSRATILGQRYDLTEQVRSLAVDALLVFADEDAITPDHIVQFWKELGGGGRGEAGLDGTQRTSNALSECARAETVAAAMKPRNPRGLLLVPTFSPSVSSCGHCA